MVVFITLIFWACFYVKFSSTGNGQHVGYVTAVDQNGYIYKNYQVYFKTDTLSSQEDVYCINKSNKSLVDMAKRASVTRKLVTIEYHGVRGIGLDICGGDEIDSIK